MKTGIPPFVADLISGSKGDVYHDAVVLGMYSTDASVYQIMPSAVVCPRDEEDVRHCLRIATQYKVPILARGGGTSLAGQTVSEGIVLDFSKYMNTFSEPVGDTIIVQPGVVRHQLNQFLKKYQLEFAPDPATSTRATIGGMTANNSSGTKSILYGKTSDHVLEMKVMLADGQVIHTRPLSANDLAQKLNGSDPDRFYYRAMLDIAEPLEDEVRSRYPKTMRRVGGYALDDFLSSGCGDLNRIIIGSEGTLGIILEAKLKLVPLPKYKGVSVVHFNLARDAIRAVTTMVQYHPSAVEILSRLLIGYSRKNRETASMCGFLNGDPDSIQIVEFYGDDPEEIRQRAEAMHADLQSKGFGYAHDYYPEGRTYHDVWGIRERGLGLMLGEPTDKKGVPVIEDAAIPLEHLDAFIADVVEICARHGIEVDYYAHASVGVIHIKPLLDMRVEDDIEKFKSIGYETFRRVMHYGGSWSSEHGDGIVRSGFLKEFYGERIYEAFEKIKLLFDPDQLLNPGKIVNPPPMDSHLRYGGAYHDIPFDAAYVYREQRDFHTAIHQCSGLGACRKLSGGTMCPSFMVTKDEVDSTRGRANALRLAMSGQLPDGMANRDLPKVMELCLSCKACKAECPSSVDMARLKGELLQHHHDLYGASRKDRWVGASPELARRFAGWPARWVNMAQRLPLIKPIIMKAMGLDSRRQLPVYATQKFSAISHGGSDDTPDAVMLHDTYMECHETDSGRAALRVFELLGKKLLVLNAGCCQRPRISHGFLREAAKRVEPGIERILPWLQKGVPVFVLEPGCASAWKDDIPDLLRDDVKAEWLKNITTFEHVVAEILRRDPSLADRIRPVHHQIRVHGHCHQKSIFGMQPVRDIMAHWPEIDFAVIDSGCCGMAGSFGYEEKHYDTSRKMAERVLVPAIHASPDAFVVANGFSCRHQIHDFAGVKARHIVHMFLKNK